ncbi:MAG: hypothetical protein ABIU05_05175 [Nitrospirales bacterium]
MRRIIGQVLPVAERRKIRQRVGAFWLPIFWTVASVARIEQLPSLQAGRHAVYSTIREAERMDDAGNAARLEIRRCDAVQAAAGEILIAQAGLSQIGERVGMQG